MMKMRTLNKYHAFGRIGDGFEMAFTFSLSIYVYCNIFSITFSLRNHCLIQLYLFILKEIAMGP